MGDPSRGLYEKFIVRRTDENPRHDGCEYFVLDLTHDPHAGPALAAYADSCESDYPLLAADLRRINPPLRPFPPTPEQEGDECLECHRADTLAALSLSPAPEQETPQ